MRSLACTLKAAEWGGSVLRFRHKASFPRRALRFNNQRFSPRSCATQPCFEPVAKRRGKQNTLTECFFCFFFNVLYVCANWYGNVSFQSTATLSWTAGCIQHFLNLVLILLLWTWIIKKKKSSRGKYVVYSTKVLLKEMLNGGNKYDRILDMQISNELLIKEQMEADFAESCCILYILHKRLTFTFFKCMPRVGTFTIEEVQVNCLLIGCQVHQKAAAAPCLQAYDSATHLNIFHSLTIQTHTSSNLWF